MLPISVLVPTRNSMSLLPAHIEGMRAWLDLVEEVVAVDSHSNDGTLEYLRRELKHPNVRVLTHPPGLYQSWNHGIAQCGGKYIYISTIGERISRDGIEKLFVAAESFRADVTISPPSMTDLAGASVVKEWPIHSLLAQARLAVPAVLDGAAVQLFAITHLLRGILGSSASNVYAAAALKAHPFRTDFGTAGDLAWGLEHAAETRLAIVPETFSTFVFHPKSYAKSDYAVVDFPSKCLALAREAVQRKHPYAPDNAMSDLMFQLLAAWEKFLAGKGRVVSVKQSPVWWLTPAGWDAHRSRADALRQLQAFQTEAMTVIAQRCSAAL